MKIISNRFSIIFYSTLFNLLFEYSARGSREFVERPLLVMVLFGIYFTYFAMIEDLILRCRPKNIELFMVAFLYGLFPTAFLTRNLFNPNIYGGIMLIGVNIGTLMIVGILSWGVVQGMITLYFANRILPRDWDHPRMGKVGWGLAIFYQLVVMIKAHFNPVAPYGALSGYLVVGLLVVLSSTILVASLKTPRPQKLPFQSSRVMDFLALSSVLIYVILGTFFISGPAIVTSQPLNLIAVTIENIWVIICGIVFFAYRWWKKSDVQI